MSPRVHRRNEDPPRVRPRNLAPPRVFPPGPRKVIVATTIFPVFAGVRPWRGLEFRCQEIAARLDHMARDARRRWGRGPDLAVFPENALNPPEGRDVLERAVVLDGPVREIIGARARDLGVWVVVGGNLLEGKRRPFVSNAAVLFDRRGDVAGVYRKVFLSGNDPRSNRLEGGKRPGTDFPVFDTDFGRLALLICWDMGYPDPFEAYQAQGVELVAWPTMSPQTLVPRCCARRYRMHIVSATPRDNASVFDPAGFVVARTTRPDGVRTHEIDLDCRILHWQPGLEGGAALRAAYGDRVGFRYSEREDVGIFWSNDPQLPIGRMVAELGFREETDVRRRSRQMRARALRR